MIYSEKTAGFFFSPTAQMDVQLTFAGAGYLWFLSPSVCAVFVSSSSPTFLISADMNHVI